MPEMNKAIKAHITEHKRVTGKQLKEENFTEDILKTIIGNQH